MYKGGGLFGLFLLLLFFFFFFFLFLERFRLQDTNFLFFCQVVGDSVFLESSWFGLYLREVRWQ